VNVAVSPHSSLARGYDRRLGHPISCGTADNRDAFPSLPVVTANDAAPRPTTRFASKSDGDGEPLPLLSGLPLPDAIAGNIRYPVSTCSAHMIFGPTQIERESNIEAAAPYRRPRATGSRVATRPAPPSGCRRRPRPLGVATLEIAVLAWPALLPLCDHGIEQFDEPVRPCSATIRDVQRG
jgi:hypothetical protein